LTGQGSFWFGSSDFYPETIDQSLRFESGYLGRTPSSASNQKTWTFSCWFKIGNTSANHTLWSAGATGTPRLAVYLSSGGQLITDIAGTGTYDQSVALFRDTTNWYHLVWVFDTTQASGSNRSRMYVNGTEITLTKTRTFSENTNYAFNGTVLHTTGGLSNSTGTFASNLYLAEVNFVDGTALTPTSFGETKNGVWIPKDYSGSYGTNGFRMTFGNSSAIGEDSAGSNDFGTVNNINDYDIVPDSPTNNFCVINNIRENTLVGGSVTLSEGNLQSVDGGTTYGRHWSGTFGMTTGKWYWEVLAHTIGGSYGNIGLGNDVEKGTTSVANGAIAVYYGNDGKRNPRAQNAGTTTYGDSYTNGDIIGIAFDADNESVTFYKNNSSQGAVGSVLVQSTGPYFPSVGDGQNSTTYKYVANFGQDSSFAGNKTAQGNTDGNGVGDFYYSPPSGYLALCSSNLPDTTFSPNKDEQATDYFNTVLYTGNGSTNAITGVGFQPDWVWSKRRNASGSHNFWDSSRGTTKLIFPDAGSVTEKTVSGLTSFDSDGFTMGSEVTYSSNINTSTYVAWNWKINGGTTSSNTEGSLTCTTQANTEAGISIVTWTGDGNASVTLGHGLEAKPELIIYMGLDNTYEHPTWYKTFGTSTGSFISTDNQPGAFARVQSEPTDTLIPNAAKDYTNVLNEDNIAYVFHSVDGFSKISQYTGNSLADGTFVYTGFRPAWIMVKKTTGADNWIIHDNARSPTNVVNGFLVADTSDDEFSDDSCDFLSNGFKWRLNSGARNTSGQTYLYMAFAEQPFKFSNAR
jgi:hypothetical protein